MSNTVTVSKRLFDFASSIENPHWNSGIEYAEQTRTLMHRNDYNDYNYTEKDVDRLIEHIDDNLIMNTLNEKFVTYLRCGKWTTPICISVNENKQVTLHQMSSDSEDMSDREVILSKISDRYKDVTGIRPMMSFDAYSDEDLQNFLVSLLTNYDPR